jgi:signal transduction histidine kinase
VSSIALPTWGRLFESSVRWCWGTPTRRFNLVSLLILLLGMATIGWWINDQIAKRVVQQIALSDSIYIESFVAPSLQDLGTRERLDSSETATFDSILYDTPLADQIVAFVIWGQDGHVLYSSSADQVGRRFEPDDTLQQSYDGEVTWELIDSTDELHIPDQHRANDLLAIYSPIREKSTGRVIAVTEFYQRADQLEQEITSTQRITWLVIALVTAAMYVVLIRFVRQASDTITRQQSELSAQVMRLTDLLAQNDELRDRMQQATHRAATLNERLLRHVSADLHDGPAQYLGLAMLHIDRVAEYHEEHPTPPITEYVEIVQSSLTQAIEEVRAISSGLGIPQIDAMALEEIVDLVIQNHERHTQSEVNYDVDDLPDQVGPAIKSTLYRVLQEGLSNAYRHGQGRGQHVNVVVEGSYLVIRVSDNGPGFDLQKLGNTHEHLGIVGMRDRVESLGGRFSITSQLGHGTRLEVQLPLYDVAAQEG